MRWAREQTKEDVAMDLNVIFEWFSSRALGWQKKQRASSRVKRERQSVGNDRITEAIIYLKKQLERGVSKGKKGSIASNQAGAEQ